MDKYDVFLTVLGPIVGFVSKIYNGFLSDFSMKRLPRVMYLLVANSLQTLLLFVCIFTADSLTVLVMATIFLYNANGANMSLTPSVIGDCFGVKHFGQTYGWAQPGYAIIGWILQAILGLLYEREITDPNSTNCYGKKCFKWTFLLVTLLSLVAVILNSIFLYRQVHRMRIRQIIMRESQSVENPSVSAVNNIRREHNPRFNDITDYQALGASEEPQVNETRLNTY